MQCAHFTPRRAATPRADAELTHTPHAASRARPFVRASRRARYRAFQDAPWCAADPPLYAELAAAFPRAKFVLTVRPSDAWWRSIRVWLECLKPFNRDKYARLLGATEYSEAAFKRAYDGYNAAVRAHFATAPHRLLVIDLTAPQDGAADTANGSRAAWPRLCEFLEAWKACPSGALPHMNDVAGQYRGVPRGGGRASEDSSSDRRRHAPADEAADGGGGGGGALTADECDALVNGSSSSSERVIKYGTTRSKHGTKRFHGNKTSDGSITMAHTTTFGANEVRKRASRDSASGDTP